MIELLKNKRDVSKVKKKIMGAGINILIDELSRAYFDNVAMSIAGED